MKRGLTALLVLFLLGARAGASEYAADFIHLGTGAAAAAMGGAWGTSKAGATSFYWNPALVLDDQPYKLYVESVTLFDGLSSYQSAACQLRLREHWALSAGAQYQLVSDIPRYDELGPGRDLSDPEQRSDGGVSGAPFESSSLATTVSLSREFWFDVFLGSQLMRNRLPSRLALGASLRMVNQTLDGFTGSGTGLDLGFKLIIGGALTAGELPPQEILLAVSRQNLLSRDISWDTPSGHGDPVPANTKVGLSWYDEFDLYPVSYRIALEKDSAYEGPWHLGLESAILERFTLRTGLAGASLTDAVASFGAGLRLRHLLVDYAYVTHDLGASHRVGLELRF